MSATSIDWAAQSVYLTDVILANGETLTWSRKASTPDATKPWLNDSGATSSWNVKVLFVRAGSGILSALMHYIAKTDVPARTYKAFVLPQAGFIPKLGDIATRVAETLSVSSVDQIGPAFNVVGYIVTFDQT